MTPAPRRVGPGLWVLEGSVSHADEALAEWSLSVAEARSRDGADWALDSPVGRVWVKGGPVRRHGRWRHGLAHRLGGRMAPRLRECALALGLLDLGLCAVRPLWAAARYRRSALESQVLVLAPLPPGENAERALWGADPTGALAVAARLGASAARLHRLGVDHRDLFARNAWLLERGPNEAVLWLDHWRGRNLAGPLHRRLRARGLAQLVASLPGPSGGPLARAVEDAYRAGLGAKAAFRP